MENGWEKYIFEVDRKIFMRKFLCYFLVIRLLLKRAKFLEEIKPTMKMKRLKKYLQRAEIFLECRGGNVKMLNINFP